MQPRADDGFRATTTLQHLLCGGLGEWHVVLEHAFQNRIRYFAPTFLPLLLGPPSACGIPSFSPSASATAYRPAAYRHSGVGNQKVCGSFHSFLISSSIRCLSAVDRNIDSTVDIQFVSTIVLFVISELLA